MLVVLFKIRARADVDEAAYEAAFLQMLDRVGQIRGYLGFESYTGEDGTELGVATFEDDIALADWREEPDHVATRRRGHDEFFEAYDITVATVGRHYAWSRSDDGNGD